MIKKNPNLKHIFNLPFNYGLGQTLGFLNRKNTFYYIRDLSLKATTPMFGYYFALLKGIMVRDPQAVKEIMVSQAKNFPKNPISADIFESFLGKGLVASSGDHWRVHRTLIAPVFTPENVSKMVDIMKDETRKYCDEKWKKMELDGVVTINNASNEISKLTQRIIAGAAFGSENETFFDEMADLWHDLVQDFGSSMFLIAIFGVYSLYLPLPNNMRFLKNKQKMTKMVKGLIEKRKTENSQKMKGKELLSLMIDAEDEDGKKIDDQGLVDESLTFLFAGHDTTSALLSFMFWKLAENPKVQEKLFNELQEVFGDEDPKYEQLDKLTYMSYVINETLRMYPPAINVQKIADKDTEIMGYAIPKGSYLLVDILATHYNSKVWENPMTFDPERWTPDRIKEVPLLRYAFIPFSAGSRNCVGKLFAQVEAPLVASMILKRYNIEMADDGKKIFADATFVLKADNLNLKFTRRNK
eukprot:gene8985-1084_t